jgi:hypothetical protein
MNASALGCGLAHELGMTAAKAGWELSDFSSLADSEEKCRQVLSFLRGHAEIQIREHFIYCDATPFIPKGWSVLPDEEQIPTRLRGQFKWDKEKQKDAFYLSGCECIGGNELREELAEKRIVVLPANVLNYLLDDQRLIPEDWKKDEGGKILYIYFWGTIYSSSVDRLCVFYLYWGGNEWRYDYECINKNWRSNNLAAVSASHS